MYEFHLVCFCESPTPVEIRGSGDYCRILTYKRFFQLSFIFRQTFVLKVSQLCPWGLRRSDEFPSHKNVMVEIDRGVHRYATMAWWPCATPPSNILPALPYPLSEVSYRSGSRDTPKCGTAGTAKACFRKPAYRGIMVFGIPMIMLNLLTNNRNNRINKTNGNNKKCSVCSQNIEGTNTC